MAKQNKDEMSACFMNRLYYYTANICFSIWSKIIFQLLLLSLNIECVGAGASGGGGAVYDVRTNFNIHVNGWARRQQQAVTGDTQPPGESAGLGRETVCYLPRREYEF